MAKSISNMKAVLRVLLICLGGTISIVFLSTYLGLPRVVLNTNIEFTGKVIYTSKYKQCPAMFMKNERKRSKNVGKESRSPPFWLTKEIKNNNIFVTNNGNGGRIGNKLFEFAAVFGVSKLNNRIPILKHETLVSINKYFDTRVFAVNNFSRKSSNFVTFKEQNCHIRMNETKHLPKNNVSIGSYLLNRFYFENAREELRDELVFKDSIIDVARKYLNISVSNSSKGTTFARVVVHERRGDLLSILRNISGFAELTSDYYSQSMTYFRQCYDRIQFVVISDDIEWCKENIVGPDVIYSEGHSPGVDLAISSLCDHAIITRGTFSIWVGWFANGITIRPLRDHMPNTKASNNSKQQIDSYPFDSVFI